MPLPNSALGVIASRVALEHDSIFKHEYDNRYNKPKTIGTKFGSFTAATYAGSDDDAEIIEHYCYVSDFNIAKFNFSFYVNQDGIDIYTMADMRSNGKCIGELKIKDCFDRVKMSQIVDFIENALTKFSKRVNR
jgi:hypothetical protein